MRTMSVRAIKKVIILLVRLARREIKRVVLIFSNRFRGFSRRKIRFCHNAVELNETNDNNYLAPLCNRSQTNGPVRHRRHYCTILVKRFEI